MSWFHENLVRSRSKACLLGAVILSLSYGSIAGDRNSLILWESPVSAIQRHRELLMMVKINRDRDQITVTILLFIPEQLKFRVQNFEQYMNVLRHDRGPVMKQNEIKIRSRSHCLALSSIWNFNCLLLRTDTQCRSRPMHIQTTSFQ